MCLSFRNKLLEIQEAWAASTWLWVPGQTWPGLHAALFRRKNVIHPVCAAGFLPFATFNSSLWSPNSGQPVPPSGELFLGKPERPGTAEKTEGGRVSESDATQKGSVLSWRFLLAFVYDVFVSRKKQHVEWHSG